jgi:hypothetical protein
LKEINLSKYAKWLVISNKLKDIEMENMWVKFIQEEANYESGQYSFFNLATDLSEFIESSLNG